MTKAGFLVVQSGYICCLQVITFIDTAYHDKQQQQQQQDSGFVPVCEISFVIFVSVCPQARDQLRCVMTNVRRVP